MLICEAMSQTPRNQIFHEYSPFHIIWQCHNKSGLLSDNETKKLYYELLLKYRDNYQMLFYSYHLMDTHVHLIGRGSSLQSFSDFFRVIHNLFARKINKSYERRGQVVMERLKSLEVADDRYMLAAMAYVDLNGVRAGRDVNVGDNRWSSYHYYSNGKDDPLITLAPPYLALGESAKARQLEYRTIVEEMASAIKKERLNEIAP